MTGRLKYFFKKNTAFSVAVSFMVCLASLVSCGGSHSGSNSDAGETIRMRYAEHLTITEHPGFTEVAVRNPWDTLRVLQRYILVPKDSVLPANLPDGTIIRTPVRNALVYSTVHAALISELGAGESIGGVCGAEYINDSTLQRRLAEGSLANCGMSQNPDIERIIKLRPEIIMLSPYENNDRYARVSELGIPLVECADYMEDSALGRAEWVRLYGLLFGHRDDSEKMFKDTETEYLHLRDLANSVDSQPSVILDQRYGQVWYVPGSQSLMNGLIKDAGGKNPFESYGKGSVPLAPERVLAEAHDADVWFVRYNQESEKSLNELAKDAPVNSRFKAYKNGNVYGCNTRFVDFFEETPFHPDRLLRDMIIVMHPGLLDNEPIPMYFHKMQ